MHKHAIHHYVVLVVSMPNTYIVTYGTQGHTAHALESTTSACMNMPAVVPNALLVVCCYHEHYT